MTMVEQQYHEAAVRGKWLPGKEKAPGEARGRGSHREH